MSSSLASKKQALAGKVRGATRKRQGPAPAHSESELLGAPNTLDESFQSVPPYQEEETVLEKSQPSKTLESHPIDDLDEAPGKTRRGEKCETKNCEWRLWARQAKIEKAKDQKKTQMLEKKAQFMEGKLRKAVETIQKQRQEIERLRMNNKGENMRMRMEGRSMMRQEKIMDKQQQREYNLALRAMKTPEEIEAEIQNRQANIQMGLRAGASVLKFGSEVYKESKQQGMGRPGPGNQGQQPGARRLGPGNMQNSQRLRPNQMQILDGENMPGNVRGPQNRQLGAPRGPSGEDRMGRPRGPLGPGRAVGPGGQRANMGQGGMGRPRGLPDAGRGEGPRRPPMGQGEMRRSSGPPDADKEDGLGGSDGPERLMGPMGSADDEGTRGTSGPDAERGQRRPPRPGPAGHRGPARQQPRGENLRRSPRKAQSGDEENQGRDQMQQKTSPRKQRRTSQDEPLQPLTPPANHENK